MVDEFFYGFTLKGENAEHQWSGNKQLADDEDDTRELSSKLILKRALLGPEAADGEMNVVEVETLAMQDLIKLPIAVLKVGEERQVNLGELEFFDAPVTFRLVKGKGPVHVLGQHLQQEEDSSMADMEEFADEADDFDSDNEIKATEEDGNPKKKLKLSKKAKNDKGK